MLLHQLLTLHLQLLASLTNLLAHVVLVLQPQLLLVENILKPVDLTLGGFFFLFGQLVHILFLFAF